MTLHAPTVPYSTDKFDAAYYGGKARGGFGPEVHWDSPDQQDELAKKWDTIARLEPYDRVLFVGCGLGGEVRYFQEHGKNAYGVDVSEYAIAQATKVLGDRVRLFNGWDLSLFKYPFDVIAAFDVLTLVPEDMLAKLVTEMQRLCSNRVVFRTIIKNRTSKGRHWIGTDGVSFRYLSLEEWDELFSHGFDLEQVTVDRKREAVFVFKRI